MTKKITPAALTRIANKHGLVKGSEIEPHEYMPTGMHVFDRLWGDHRRGPRRGGGITIYGTPESGKSTWCYQLCAALQKRDERCLIFDVENSFDAGWAQQVGVNLEDLYICPLKQDNMDEVLETVREVIETGAFNLVIVDSLHALGTKAEMKQEVTDNRQVGALATTVTQFMRTTHASRAKSDTALLIIGQMRMNIDTHGGGQTLTGGNALEHGMDMVIRLNRSNAKNSVPKDPDDNPIGHLALGWVEKCRGPGTHKGFTMPFINGVGFSEVRMAVEEALVVKGGKLLGKSGSWLAWTDKEGEEHKMQGKWAMMSYMEEHPEEFEQLAQKLFGDEDESTEEVQEDTSGEDNSGPVEDEDGTE